MDASVKWLIDVGAHTCDGVLFGKECQERASSLTSLWPPITPLRVTNTRCDHVGHSLLRPPIWMVYCLNSVLFLVRQFWARFVVSFLAVVPHFWMIKRGRIKKNAASVISFGSKRKCYVLLFVMVPLVRLEMQGSINSFIVTKFYTIYL